MKAYNPEYKQNWPVYFDRMTRWWNGTLDSPILRIPWVSDQPAPGQPEEEQDWEALAFDTAGMIRSHEEIFHSTHYFVDQAPNIQSAIGHGLPTYLGCPMVFRRETAWTFPCLQRIDEPVDVTRWRTNPRWQFTEAQFQEFTRRSALRYGVRYNLGGIIQSIATMRGDAAFLMDIIDHPEAVESLRDRLLPEWMHMAETLERLMPTEAGYWTVFGLWAPERAVFCECDISCNLSPAHFRRFVMPELEALTRWARYSMYHLDGPGAVHQLDALLELPELDAVQWIRGDGGGEALDWLPLMQRVQAGGKLLYTECPPADLRVLLETLNPHRLLVAVEPVTTAAEMELALSLAAEYGSPQDV